MSVRRLTFGVPLEDVFPESQVHPSLMKAFDAQYKIVLGWRNSLEKILTISTLQGTDDERLTLKERLVLNRPLSGLIISPGVLFWLIRYYFEMLPTPLLPTYANGCYYNWKKLSSACRNVLSYYVTDIKTTDYLAKIISHELLRLPKANFRLTVVFLSYIRKMVVLPSGEPKITKGSALALSEYFSSSLFQKPFQPGDRTKTGRHHQSLLLFLIINWPVIMRTCMDSSKMSREDVRPKIHQGRSIELLHERPMEISKRFSDETTQTEPLDEFLIRVTRPSRNELDFLKDISCQTDLPKVPNTTGVCCGCCSIGSHYEKHSGSSTDVVCSSSSGEDCSFDEMIVADTSFQEPGSDLKHQPSSLVEKEEKGKRNEILKKHSVEEVGRRLPEAEDQGSPKLELDEPSNKLIGCRIFPTNRYRLSYEDVRKSLTEELKQKFQANVQSSTKIASGNEGEVVEVLNETLGCAETQPLSKKSLINVNKIKSKLEVLSIFSTKKMKVKKSLSSGEKSGVRYKKMGSCSSVLSQLM